VLDYLTVLSFGAEGKWEMFLQQDTRGSHRVVPGQAAKLITALAPPVGKEFTAVTRARQESRLSADEWHVWLGAAHGQALEIRCRLAGNDHPDTTGSLNNLGVLLMDMGDLAAARPHLEQALEGLRRVLGNTHPRTAKSLNNLSVLEVASARIDEAVALMREASVIDDRMIGQVFSIGSDQQ
jgi:tetratricopeptide (TPR) repeat protein